MNSAETGKLIAKLRKEAGYTQKSLAEQLFVTDKAVSKWERGICMPDSSLLTKLSTLLDADVEYIIGGDALSSHKWVGEIRVDDVKGEIAGKPLVHYLLSYFMLVGIKDVAIICKDKDYVKSLNLERYGLNVSFTRFNSARTMILYDKAFVFGVNLTRQFQSYMITEQNVIPMVGGRKLPLVFTRNANLNREWHEKNAIAKNLGRGMVFLPLDTEENLRDVGQFVAIYEKYHGEKIADLNEIAKKRELIR